MADDFVLPGDWIAWAIAERRWSDGDARTEAANFCDYWQARAGRDGIRRDWRKTWQTWVRNSRRAGAKPSAARPAPADDPHAAERLALFRRHQAGEIDFDSYMARKLAIDRAARPAPAPFSLAPNPKRIA